jgi:1D-myo-inositol 3-kinase
VPRHDYVTVGHVTVDVLSDGSRQPGGSALYSALQAARLELRAHILTQGNPRELAQLLEPYRDELDLTVLPAAHTTTLRTRGEGAARRQRLLAWAGPIAGPVEVDTAILHLAPVAREIPRVCFDAHPPRADFVGLTPQGLVREWDAHGDIAPRPLDRELLPARCHAIVFSAAERESCEALIPKTPARRPLVTGAAPTPIDPARGALLAGDPRIPADPAAGPPLSRAAPIPRDPAGGALVAVTAGAQPTTLHLPTGETLHIPVPPIESPREDLGAGDVFAAALFVALREGRPPAEAAAFANAAAAVRIAGAGPRAIGDRRAIGERLGAH